LPGVLAKEKIHPALSQESGSAPVAVIVEYGENDALDETLLEAHQCETGHVLNIVHGIAAECPADRLDDIAEQEYVRYVWEDAVYPLALEASVPLINATLVWQQFGNGTGVNVSVLDSGINVSHPALASKVILQKDFTGEEILDDRCNHGTAVACAVGCLNDDAPAGVAPGAGLFNAKVARILSQSPLQCGVSNSDAIAAIEWSIENHAQVLQLSFGGPEECTQSILANAVNRSGKNITIVVAAGNNGLASPGCAENALTVGASDGDAVADFSGGGDPGPGYLKPDLVAPGVDITAAHNSGISTSEYTGTSIAAPHVSGVVALMLQHRRLRPEEVKNITKDTAYDLGAPEDRQGGGRVDAWAAVARTLEIPVTFTLNASELFRDTTYGETGTRINATVRNEGNSRVNATSARIILPEGVTLLSPADTAALGDIPGLEQRKTGWLVQTQQPGNYSFTVIANASNADTVNRTEIIELFAPVLAATMQVPAGNKAAQPFVVNATVTNSGTATAQNVTASLAAPENLTILDGTGRSIGTLAPASSATVSWTLNASRSGNYSLNITTAASNAATQLSAAPVTVDVTLFTFEIQYGNQSGTDTYMRSENPTLNYGGSTLMRVETGNPTRRPLVLLDLSAVPADAAIRSATYTLFLQSVMNSQTNNIKVYRVTHPWTEGTGNGANTMDGATWNTHNGTASWTTPGGEYDSTVLWAAKNVSTPNKHYSWNITNLAKAWHDGTHPNHGLILIAAGGSRKDFASGDNNNATRRPFLQVNYTL
jgi:hypothetical protein